MAEDIRLNRAVKSFVQILKKLKNKNKSVSTTTKHWKLTYNAVDSKNKITATNNKTKKVVNLQFDLDKEKLEIKN